MVGVNDNNVWLGWILLPDTSNRAVNYLYGFNFGRWLIAIYVSLRDSSTNWMLCSWTCRWVRFHRYTLMAWCLEAKFDYLFVIWLTNFQLTRFTWANKLLSIGVTHSQILVHWRDWRRIGITLSASQRGIIVTYAKFAAIIFGFIAMFSTRNLSRIWYRLTTGIPGSFAYATRYLSTNCLDW